MTAPAGPAKHGRIVVGVDGSTPSVAALRWAAAVAPALHADIEAWMVWSYPVAYGLAPLPGWDFAADAEKALQLTLDTAFGPERPATLTAHVKQGLAPHTLIEASRGADLLVVGNRGYGGFKGLLLGSVSTACVQHARCPVVVVRGAGHEPDGKADHEADHEADVGAEAGAP
jgi:nucleotide-binding universal stress UspA family protein